MKWINHQALTGVLAYALTEDLLFSAGAIYGSIIPDKIEGKENWQSRHRKTSHWALLYIVAFIGVLHFFNIDCSSESILNASAPIRMIVALIFGALCHIAEDALCGKVPTITPNIKWGVRLFKVGSFQEYIIVFLLILAIYYLKPYFSFFFL